MRIAGLGRFLAGHERPTVYIWTSDIKVVRVGEVDQNGQWHVRITMNETSPSEALYKEEHRWLAAVQAGLLAGCLGVVFPGGTPWSSASTPKSISILGRPFPSDDPLTFFSGPYFGVLALHFLVALFYACIISIFIYRLRSWKAILTGILIGLGLYGLGWLILRWTIPTMTGGLPLEVAVALHHILFGGIAAGLYRGFLRPPVPQPSIAPDNLKKGSASNTDSTTTPEAKKEDR